MRPSGRPRCMAQALSAIPGTKQCAEAVGSALGDLQEQLAGLLVYLCPGLWLHHSSLSLGKSSPAYTVLEVDGRRLVDAGEALPGIRLSLSNSRTKAPAGFVNAKLVSGIVAPQTKVTPDGSAGALRALSHPLLGASVHTACEVRPGSDTCSPGSAKRVLQGISSKAVSMTKWC